MRDDLTSDLDLRIYDGQTADPAAAARVRGWVQAVGRGFHLARFDDDMVERWLRHGRVDGLTMRGAWATSVVLGDADVPVATYGSWDKDINVGGGRRLPLHMISDITVAPTHRRHGLLRRMMVDDLRAAADRGLPLAALTVSEGTIYGRFGFGVATHYRTIEVDVTSRFALRPEARPADGELALLAPGDEAAKAVDAVFGRVHGTTRGSVDRPAAYHDYATEGFDFGERSADGKRRICVLVDGGEPTGYVAYRNEDLRDQPQGRMTARVFDLMATSPQVELRLWRYLADLDLTERVIWDGAPLLGVIDWAVTDPRGVRTVGTRDRLWVRVLDVPVALAARPWGADGEVVLDVDDDLGVAVGRHRVVVRDGRAEVTPTDDSADLRLAADTLGSLYLGGVAVDTLAASGRLAGDAAAVGRFTAMADVGPAPYCATGF